MKDHHLLRCHFIGIIVQEYQQESFKLEHQVPRCWNHLNVSQLTERWISLSFGVDLLNCFVFCRPECCSDKC